MSTDFRQLAVELCLADGKIDETEVKIIKKALYEDGKIQQKEAEFLIDLRSLAQKKAKGRSLTPAFENFFFKGQCSWMYCFRHFSLRMSNIVYLPGVQSHFLIFVAYGAHPVCGAAKTWDTAGMDGS